MKTLSKKDLTNLIIGSTLLSTGGGGSFLSAKKLTGKIKKIPKLAGLDELKDDSLVVTVFGVGGKENCNPAVTSKIALRSFENIFRKKIAAIIPVEIGPLATIVGVFAASVNNLPVLDADIVGFRSSPEVFLETITMANLSREPSVIANDKGDILILYKSKNIKTTEDIFRNFAALSGGDAFVAGYPLTVKQIRSVVANGSIRASIKIGGQLSLLKRNKISLSDFCRKNGFKILGEGKIVKEEKIVKKGFSFGKLQIINKAAKTNFQIFTKNENIVLLKNKRVILTVPDSICLLNKKTLTGILNFENNLGKEVFILGRKAISIWRTKKGEKLFSPKNLGFAFKQKLL